MKWFWYASPQTFYPLAGTIARGSGIAAALLAALVHVSLATTAVSADLRITLAAGFLGGFTTYSAFSQETFAYLQNGAWAVGSGYVAITLVGCLLACLLGQSAARWLVGG